MVERFNALSYLESVEGGSLLAKRRRLRPGEHRPHLRQRRSRRLAARGRDPEPVPSGAGRRPPQVLRAGDAAGLPARPRARRGAPGRRRAPRAAGRPAPGGAGGRRGRAVDPPVRARDGADLAVARAMGATTIALTDNPSSPLVEHADHVFYVEVAGVTILRSMTAVVSLVQALASAVSTELEHRHPRVAAPRGGAARGVRRLRRHGRGARERDERRRATRSARAIRSRDLACEGLSMTTGAEPFVRTRGGGRRPSRDARPARAAQRRLRRAVRGSRARPAGGRRRRRRGPGAAPVRRGACLLRRRRPQGPRDPRPHARRSVAPTCGPGSGWRGCCRRCRSRWSRRCTATRSERVRSWR
jgi:hypothetical protein